MNLTFSAARTLVAVVAITGVTGTAATTASASTTSHGKQATKAKGARKKAPKRADLVARGLTLDLTDDGFSVTASIVNTGAKLAKSSDVVIALSSDTTLDGDDDLLDEYSIGTVGAGVTRSFEDDVDLPADEDFGGTAYLLVCADGNANVRESNESNNCVSQPVDTGSDGSSADDGSDDSSDDGGDDVSGDITLTDGQ